MYRGGPGFRGGSRIVTAGTRSFHTIAHGELSSMQEVLAAVPKVYPNGNTGKSSVTGGQM